MSEDGPKAAAAPKFTHEELLTGFRLVVADLQKYYALRIEQKHADYPKDTCTHRMQIAYATGQILRSVETILALVRQDDPEQNEVVPE